MCKLTRTIAYSVSVVVFLFQFGISVLWADLVHKLPENQTPYWLADNQEFVGFRSTVELPKKADVVIIGAGLTGVSAAYHLKALAREGKRIVILEANHPAAGASGRNGGNFQLLAESHTGDYEGLLKERLKLTKNREQAEREVKALIHFNQGNSRRLKAIVRQEMIECDFSETGWLRLPASEVEEKGILSDLEAIRGLGFTVSIWSPVEIQNKLGIVTPFIARMIHGDGNYHPYKFVVGVLKAAMRDGVMLFTGVKVNELKEGEEGDVLLSTSEGGIQAKKVIVATNAYTPALLPELRAIYTHPSQVMDLEDVEDHLSGLTVTELNGDIYYNFPKSTRYVDENGVAKGMLHIGLDFDEPAKNADAIIRSEVLYQKMRKFTDERFSDSRLKPASRVWAGPMAYTPDRFPVIGFLNKGIIVAAAFQGYGGSFCVEAGSVAAKMAITGEIPESVSEDLFGPGRFLGSAGGT